MGTDGLNKYLTQSNPFGRLPSTQLRVFVRADREAKDGQNHIWQDNTETMAFLGSSSLSGIRMDAYSGAFCFFAREVPLS